MLYGLSCEDILDKLLLLFCQYQSCGLDEFTEFTSFFNKFFKIIEFLRVKQMVLEYFDSGDQIEVCRIIRELDPNIQEKGDIC